MALKNDAIEQYLLDTKKILLATVADNKSDIRILGGFVTEGLVTYFTSKKEANKVKQIIQNPNVSIYFEKPDQVFPNYINITIYGEAKIIDDREEFEKVEKCITRKLPHLKIGEETNAIIKVIPKTIKIYNSASELESDKIQVIEI